MRNVTKYLSVLMVALSMLVFVSQGRATILLTEGFNSATPGSNTPPAGWGLDVVSGGANATYYLTQGTWPSVAPYEGTLLVDFESFDYGSGTVNRLKRTTPISTVGYGNITVDFEWYLDIGYYGTCDNVQVEWSTNGSSWTTAGPQFCRYSTTGSDYWQLETVTLPSGASGQSTLYVALLFTSDYGDDCHLDLLHVNGSPAGNITGTVRNINTNQVLQGVSVSCGGVGPVITNSSGVYALNGVPVGNQTLTANLAGYYPYSATVNIIFNTTITDNFLLTPIPPGYLQGTVTNASNGNAVVGAMITWNGMTTYSTAGGAYTFGNIYNTGTSTLNASKEGFNSYSVSSVTVTAGNTTTLAIPLPEDTPAPGTPFTAALNTAQTAVNLNWNLPVDDYDLIYDDGIQDNFGIYLTGHEKNMNAVRFTPLGYPVIVKGFYYNIGTASNYQVGWNAFTPVEMFIYSESAGLPGIPVDSVNVTPTNYGWNKAYFTTPMTFNSGNFYIVMAQVGYDTVSPGIAIDTTAYQMRSYSKMQNVPWLPAPGNYMIRAIVNGSGGPLMTSDQPSQLITASPIPGLIYEYKMSTVTGVEGSPLVYPEIGGLSPDNITGYQVWRLVQGNEALPATWTSVGTTTGLTEVDNSWPSLPCNPYRWAAEAQYTFNRWSNATFSNAVGKCWTCTVTVNVHLSCDSVTPAGAIVTFTNLLPAADTVYTATLTSAGTHVFSNFWQGSYSLTVSKFGYQTYTQSPINILGDMTFNVGLLQLKGTPSNLVVHDSAAYATWHPAQSSSPYSDETFTTGLDGWTPDGNSYWGLNPVDGNPGSCIEWDGYPNFVLYYSQAITSPVFSGVPSALKHLQFDISYLTTFGATNSEHLTVEVSSDGTTWNKVGDFVNNAYSMPYTTETIDITQYAPSSGFQVRFRANGFLAYYLYRWDIDNVKILEVSSPNDPCIIGYDFYLNGVIDGFTPDTVYNIPPSHLTYGTTYTACVAAIYGSGYGPQICTTFTDHFLCPPDTVNATDLECSALITWHKPNCGGCTLSTYVFDDGTAGDGLTGYGYSFGNYFPIAANAAGVIKSVDMWFSSIAGSTSAQTITLNVYKPDQSTIIGSTTFVNTGAAWPASTDDNVPFSTPVAYTGPFYLMCAYPSGSQFANYFCLDNTSSYTGFPNGVGYSMYNGTWTQGDLGYDPKCTWLQHANVCVSSKDKDAPVSTIYPAQNPVMAKPDPNTVSSIATLTDAPYIGSSSVVAPEAPATAPTVLGYNVFRGTQHIAYLPYPDTTQYYDYNLSPGTYHYTVNARYSTPGFNPPADTAVSLTAPPAAVTISCGYPLPFYEPWDQASFAYQQWSFAPNQGNWSISTAVGDPVPCADFSWEPVVTNYSTSLITPNINASMYTCATIYCDFDLKLADLHATGTEKLDVEVSTSAGVWISKAEYSDSGSFNWTLKHVNISAVMGKAFQLRFRANGANSGNILHWYVDNINIYAVCIPPKTLTGKENQFVTSLTWHSPKCPAMCGLKTYIEDDGVTGDGYSCPPGFVTSIALLGNYYPATNPGVVKSIDWLFSQYGSSADVSTVAKIYAADQSTLLGQSPPFIAAGAPYPSGTWDNSPCQDIPYNGAFYAMVDMFPYNGQMVNYLNLDHDTPGPTGLGWGWADCDGTWSYVVSSTVWGGNDVMATFMEHVNVCESGAKDKDAPITTLDPSTLPISHNAPVQNNGTAHHAGTNIGGTGTYVLGNPPPVKQETPEGSLLKGYNVYRADLPAGTNFAIIHNGTDTTYQDNHGSTYWGPGWKYFVTAVFQDSLNQGVTLCEPSSDTITVHFPAVGIDELTNSISLYPNPANDLVIKTIEVLDYIGKVIYRNDDVNLTNTKLDVASFNSGVYFVKITTTAGVKTSKLTVTH
jgi:hypothetical protein